MRSLFRDKFIAKCFTNRYKMKENGTPRLNSGPRRRRPRRGERKRGLGVRSGKDKETRKLLLAHHFCTDFTTHFSHAHKTGRTWSLGAEDVVEGHDGGEVNSVGSQQFTRIVVPGRIIVGWWR